MYRTSFTLRLLTVLILAAAFGLSATVDARAQRGPHHGREGGGHCLGQGKGHGQGRHADAQPGPRVLEWADELALTGEQRAAILEHHEQMRPTMQELRESGRRGDHEQMRALQEANRTWLATQLSEEQMQKLEELRTARRDERRAAHRAQGEERALERLEALDTVLGLSDAQRDGVEKILADQREQMGALRGAEGPGPKSRDDVAALRQTTRDRIAELLDDEQRERFEALDELSPRRSQGKRGRGGRGPRG